MKYNRPIIIGIMVLIALNFTFKLPLVERRLNLDESIWEKKGIEFVDSVFAHNWKNTRLSTRPAVTIEWIAGIDNLIYQQSGIEKFISLTAFNRIVFIIIWTFFSVLSFLLLCRIFDFKVALLSSVLLALYPALNNFDGIVWTDIMLMWMQLAAVLCFAIYNEEKNKKFLFLSGLFFGFSLLTKIIAWIIPAVLFLIVFIQGKLNKRQITNIISVIVIGVAVFYLLYPASWLNLYLIFDRATELELAAKNNSSFSVFYYPYSLFYNDPALAISVLLLIFVAIKDQILAKEKTAAYYGARNTSWLATGMNGFRNVSAERNHLVKNPPGYPVLLVQGRVYFYLFSFYLAVLTAISYFKDSQVENIASPRYYVPAIPFLTIFFVQTIYMLGANKKYKMVFILPLIIIASYLFNLAFNLYFVIAN